MTKLLPPPKSPGKHQRRRNSRNGRKGHAKRDPVTGYFYGGNPGNKGGTGRPPGATGEFREFLASEILGSQQMRLNLVRIVEVDIAALAAKDPTLAVRCAGLLIQVAAWAADRVEGKATQPLRFDPSESAKAAALREMTNEELIAALKTLDSEEVTR